MTGIIRPLSPTRAIRVLETSVAHALIDQEQTRDMARGTLVHAMLFNQPLQTVTIPFNSFRTKEAKVLKAAAEAEGKIVLRMGEEDEYAVASEKHGPRLANFKYTRFEYQVTWTAGGCPHRAAMDAVDEQLLFIGDVKTCKGGAAKKCSSDSAIVESGYDIQAAAYVEALAQIHHLDPRSIGFRLHFVEVEAPYGFITVPMSPTMLAFGARRWARARRKWLKAYREDRFEPYDGETTREANPPDWALKQENEIELREREEEAF